MYGWVGESVFCISFTAWGDGWMGSLHDLYVFFVGRGEARYALLGGQGGSLKSEDAWLVFGIGKDVRKSGASSYVFFLAFFLDIFQVALEPAKKKSFVYLAGS